jgi:capsule polysaccharide export protein KpsE/RkpR
MERTTQILQVLTRLRNFYGANGLDLFAPFNVRDYNESIDSKYHLPTYGRKDG